MRTVCYVNGEYCEPSQARVSIFDRAFLFGDAIYEALRINNARLFRVADHYARMANGLTSLGIPVPFSLEEFGAICSGLADRSGIHSGLIYMQVTRGEAMRSHLPPKGMRPTVIGFAQSFPLPNWHNFPGGVTVMTIEDTRWGRCDLKTTMLLANTLLKQQAHDAGAFEAVLVSKDSIVRECTTASVFAVINGTVRTSPLDKHVLPSVTRKVVLDLARTHAMPAIEERFTVAEMLGAEEAFLTSTGSDVCPITCMDGKLIGTGRIGPITERLIRLLEQTIETETR